MASTHDDPFDDNDLGTPDLSDLHDELEDLPKGVRQRLEAFIPELVKKTVTAGMGAVFTTEEGIRRLTKEMTLPKEVANYLVNTAATTKDELLRIVAREVREFLQNVQLSEELAKVLTMVTLEVKTSIRFVPNDDRQGGIEPDVMKSDIKLRRSQDRQRRRSRRSRGGGPGDGEAGSTE
jgi:hypothetical protein